MYAVEIIKMFSHLLYIRALLTAITVSLFICGCTDDSMVSVTSIPDKDSIAVISLKIKQRISDLVKTRAFDDSSISNLYILVYNDEGNLIGYKHLSSYTSPNEIEMDVLAGTNCTIYAIANLGSAPVLTGGNVDTESAFKALMCGPITTLGGVISNERLTMSGSITGVTLLGKGGVNYINTVGPINISRLVSRSTFNVTAIPGINITGYSIKNLPKYEYLVARPNANESSADDIAVGDDAQVSERFDIPTVSTTSISNLTFYTFENRRGGRVSVNGGTGTPSEQNEKAMYAPAYATYLEVYATGTPASTDERARFLSATYRIYLGADNCKNYNVKRNTSYNYIVNIYGAKNIDTRVTKVSVPSNCYIVPPNRTVIFPVSRANEDGKTRIASVNSGWTTAMLWTDNSRGLDPSGASCIKSVAAQFTDGTIKVEAGSVEGNAVVVAKVGNVIVWSWHIWVTTYDPNITNKPFNNGSYTTIFMDRNLGAINNTPQNVGSLGLFYQWGRKDPFPGASSITGTTHATIYTGTYPNVTTITINKAKTPQTSSYSGDGLPPNNLERSIQTPLTYYYHNDSINHRLEDWYTTATSQNDNLWDNNGVKTVYDPSPEGWCLPKVRTGRNGPLYSLTDYIPPFNYGYNWTSSVGWFPATGYLFQETGELLDVGSYGIYWSSSVKSNTETYTFYISPTQVRISNYKFKDNDKATYRSFGYPIRSIKE